MLMCGVCEEMEAKDGEESQLLEEPSVWALLQPQHEHPAQWLWQGALVLVEEIQEMVEGCRGWICKECMEALGKEKMPHHSLMNSL